MQFEQDSWVWVADETERYLPAKALIPFVKGCSTTVLIEGCFERDLNEEESSQVQECHPEALDPTICDLISISNLNEMAILHNLRSRYRKDIIYTNISSILISVNPLKHLPLYTPSVLADYRDGIKGKEPHIFAVAYSAYHNLLMREGDQSVVCSGESGAGKSEATKLILQFLADVSTRAVTRFGLAANDHGSSTSSTLESEVLAANPILEAFGNAKTLRNNNSSRFGKLITINFDHSGSIIGGGIINYLLEKSRVVNQAQGERNYHIFYQLLSSSSSQQAMIAELQLHGPDYFSYTNRTASTIDGVSDEKDFDEVLRSMDILGFTADEKKEVMKILAGILHFGNVKFTGKHEMNEDETAFVSNPDVAEFASSLWGVEKSAIEVSLCSRSMGTRDNIMVKYNVSQAQDARDAMTKRVYAELFQLVVDKINDELGGAKFGRHRFIGILDIFGFESFEVNSFEQLCINYCNEKLQFHFNEHIFRMEQALYESEGVAIEGIQFVDNQATLDLLEARNTGIFSLCDEEISMPKGTDETFLQKIFSRHVDSKHPSCIRPKSKDCKDSLKNFGVLHYAGPVFYNVTAFLEKNKDQLHSDILNALRASTSPLLQKMFPTKSEDGTTSGRHSGRGGNVALKTLGGQFKQQLNDLIVTLNATYPHFVRCMKPNDNKIPDQFNSLRMQDQLRYAGLLEVCRIRKLGYPIRRPFQEFYRRFRCCDVSCSSLDELLKFLTSKGVLVHGEWAKGKTRVFMRNEQAAILEDFRESALVKYVVKMQNIGRGMVARVRRRKCLKLIEDLGSAIKVREEGGLVYYLELCHLIPHEGIHLEVVKSARSLLARVTQENRVTSELKSAISSKTLQALRKSAASATAMEPPFLSPLVDEAVALAQKIEIETEATRLLSEAISSRDRRLLSAAIAYCDNSNYSCDDLENARKLLVQVEIECSALSMLEDAVSRRHVEDIDVALQRCYDAHLSALQPVALARELKDRIIQERKDASVDEMTKRLQKAIADGDLQGLKEAIAFVTSAESDLKVTSDKALLSQARNLMLELDVAATKLALSAATKNQDADALSAAISNAERLEMNCDEVDLAVKTKQLLDKSRIKDRLKARIMGKKGKVDGGDQLTPEKS